MGQFVSVRNISGLSPTTFHLHRAALSSVQQQIHVLVTVAYSVPERSSVLSLSLFLLIHMVSLSPAHCGALCPALAHFAQTSCGPGWISSPARLLLLEIQTGFWSESKSGRPSLSQHTTGLSLSVYSSSVSAVNTHTEGEFMIYSFSFFFLYLKVTSLSCFHVCTSKVAHQCFPSDIFHHSRPDSRNAVRVRTRSALLGSVLLRLPDRRGASGCQNRGTEM